MKILCKICGRPMKPIKRHSAADTNPPIHSTQYSCPAHPDKTCTVEWTSETDYDITWDYETDAEIIDRFHNEWLDETESHK